MDIDIDIKELKRLIELRSEQRWRSSLPPVLSGMRNVYEGFIGEKISKDAPAEVWASLRQSGVTQIIDLRYNYNSEKFQSRCKEHGISYYNYPIHNDPETVAGMVEHYSRFTELLCNGHFYMMGRKTSYVALCLYWALSKCPGLYPYDIRREIKHDRQLMKRVVPILYAMNKYGEERYGNDAYMPADFYERQREQIRDFIENDGPKKASYSVFDFTRAYRNETVMYDISVQEIGVVGYLYAPKNYYGNWEYDLVLRPSVSDRAKTFEDAQIGIARHLCEILPTSIKWVKLPESTKTCIKLLRNLFGM